MLIQYIAITWLSSCCPALKEQPFTWNWNLRLKFCKKSGMTSNFTLCQASKMISPSSMLVHQLLDKPKWNVRKGPACLLLLSINNHMDYNNWRSHVVSPSDYWHHKSPWKFAHNHPSPSRCDLSSFRLTILKEYICRLESLWRCWSSCSVMFDSCDPVDCGLPGSSVRGISQARILEWVATSFSRGSSCPRDGTQVSCTGRRILHH